jgi:hypothetical protein
LELTYTIQRSPRRRKLTITVERDRSIVVHAPEGISDEEIHRVVASKRQWIYEKRRHPQKYHDLPHPPGKELVNGESPECSGWDSALGRFRSAQLHETYGSWPSPDLRSPNAVVLSVS